MLQSRTLLLSPTTGLKTPPHEYGMVPARRQQLLMCCPRATTVSQEEVSSNPTQRIGAVTVEQLPLKELLLASEAAAKRGAEVIPIFDFYFYSALEHNFLDISSLFLSWHAYHAIHDDFSLFANEHVQSLCNCARKVVMAAVDKPRNIDYKGKTDLVTE
jgi:hypothetical protein